MSSYALYIPVSAAVPETLKGATILTFASVMPAVTIAFMYMSGVHQVMFLTVTSSPLPSLSASMYTAGDGLCADEAFINKTP